jgi:hypothetical protein
MLISKQPGEHGQHASYAPIWAQWREMLEMFGTEVSPLGHRG